MLHFRIPVSVFALMCLGLTTTSFGQSKTETKKFLQENVTKSKTYYRSRKYGLDYEMYNTLKFEGSTLILKSYSYSFRNKQTQRWTREVSLDKLNPNRVELKDFDPTNKVVLWVREGIRTGKGSQYVKEYGKSSKTEHFTGLGNLEFFVSDARRASRIQKAFVHLIKLYGGKGDMFEP